MKTYFESCKFSLAVVFLAVCLGILALVNFVCEPSITAVHNDLSVAGYVKAGNIFASFFKEPVETILFIFKDGTYIAFTSLDEDFIAIPANAIVDFIAERHESLADAVFIVHNHRIPSPFSESDNRTYQYFKDRGFVGLYMIYFTGSGKVLAK